VVDRERERGIALPGYGIVQERDRAIRLARQPGGVGRLVEEAGRLQRERRRALERGRCDCIGAARECPGPCLLQRR
jgi:hypothetical protein